MSSAIMMAAVVIVVIVSNVALAEKPPKWIEPTDEVTTPHIQWATPDAGGPMRVLFITYSTGMREIVELSQRFDIQREVFAMHSKNAFVPEMKDSVPYWMGPFDGADAQSVTNRLREKLAQSYDCIVIGDIEWDRLPAWARETILEKVRGGAGLVGRIAGQRDEALNKALEQKVDVDPEVFLGAFPFAGLPAFRNNDDIGTFIDSNFDLAQHGKGRVVLFKQLQTVTRQILTPGIVDPFPDLYMTHYDYYLALAGKAIRWAADREPDVRVVEPEGVGDAVKRSDLHSLTFTVQSRSPGAVQLHFVLRHSDRGTVLTSNHISETLKVGINTISFEVTPPPAGTYFADLWIKQGTKTIDFGSHYLTATSTSQIAEVAFASESFSAGDPITGTVTVKRPVPGQSLQINQWDVHQRIVATTSLPLTQEDAVSFKLSSVSPLSVLQHIQVKLLNGSDVIDERWTVSTYHDFYPPRDDVRYVVWPGLVQNSYLNVLLANVLRDAGFDTMLVGLLDHDRERLSSGAILMSNLYPLVTVYGRGPRESKIFVQAQPDKTILTDSGYARVPCLTDPTYIEAQRILYRESAQFWHRMCPPEFNLGDESTFAPHDNDVDLCFSATCIADFQRFLRREYATLDRLNEEYGTRYADWQEVLPISLDEARQSGKIPLWIDHRRHMSSVWASQFALAKKEISAVAPGAKVGYEGSDDPGHLPDTMGRGAVDYWKLANAMDFNGTYYYPLQLDAVRDFSAPGSHIGGGWFGGYTQMWRANRDSLHQRWWIWNTLLRGANAFWIYEGVGTTHYYFGVFAPDLSPYDYFKTNIEQIRIIKEGIGKLLLTSQRDDDGIAVLYSPSSMLMTTFTEQPVAWHNRYSTDWDEPASTPSVFAEAGFQYRLISSDQLADGILGDGRFRVLYLPYCQALSMREIERILAFAKEGGTVVADLRPGVADEHGKRYVQSPLDELFGVRQNTAKATPLTTTVSVDMPEADLHVEMPETFVDGSLQISKGRAIGKVPDVPAVVLNQYGQGKGILLNLAFSHYLYNKDDSMVRFVSDESATNTRALLHGVLSWAGITPEVQLTPHVPGCHVYRFTSGKALFAGLLWDAPAFLPGVPYTDFYRTSPPAPLSPGGVGGGAQDRELLASLARQHRQVKLTFPEKSHLYDMLKGAYLGYFRHLTRLVRPGHVHMLISLPYRVREMKLSLEQETLARGEVLEYSAALSVDGTTDDQTMHIFYVQLIDPQGEIARHYIGKLRAPGGRCRGSQQLAFNEKLGSWQLVVRDVATGVQAELSFVVR